LIYSNNPLEYSVNGKKTLLEKSSLAIKELARWFEQNRKPKRIFNLNPKHGENGKGAYSSNKGDKVSLLLCSREKAAMLLNKAIGENLECRVLFFKDVDKDRYIEFRSERANIYHAFHLETEEAERRIPMQIRKKIDKLL